MRWWDERAVKVTSFTRCRQRGARPRRVALELRDERRGARKTGGVAKPHDELHAHPRPVPVAGGLEEVGLERSRGVVEGRARPQVHHTPELPGRTGHAHRVDALRRQQLARRRGREVERGVAEESAPLLAVDHARAHRVRPPEAVRGRDEVPGADGPPDRGRRDDAPAAECDRRHDLDLEALAPAERDEHVDVARATAPEAVVVADEERAHPEACP
jgi:hypothetical protein